MKSFIATALMLLAPTLVLSQTPALPAAKSEPKSKVAAKPAVKAAPKTDAQSTKTAAAQKSAAAKKAEAAKKAAAAKEEATSSRTQLRSAASQAAAGISAAQAALSPAELSIAQRVHVGRMPCELGAFVTVTADAATPGHFHVEGKGFKYYMAPVVTSTGAVRLEDQKGGAVWLQIANKSMLMNQRLGQRLADECMSTDQAMVTESLKKSPPISVFDPLPAAK